MESFKYLQNKRFDKPVYLSGEKKERIWYTFSGINEMMTEGYIVRFYNGKRDHVPSMHKLNLDMFQCWLTPTEVELEMMRHLTDLPVELFAQFVEDIRERRLYCG